MFICMKTVEGPWDLVFKEEQCTVPGLDFNAMELLFFFLAIINTDTAVDICNNHGDPVFSRFRAIKRNNDNEISSCCFPKVHQL